MALAFLDGLVRYPDTLPCPQVDTNLVPRERRYISDISDVRNMRMFQQEFQATRNRISFISTEEEAREFREWYEKELIYGGAWFYADWPTLHKDKRIAHRFVGQPKYEWLLGANPGATGRSVAGYAPNVDVVPLYKITATVEIYDSGYGGYGGRKVGKAGDVYTSKIYPLYTNDTIATSVAQFGGSFSLFHKVEDKIAASIPSFAVSMTGSFYSDYEILPDDIRMRLPTFTATGKEWIYTDLAISGDSVTSSIPVFTAAFHKYVISYDKDHDDTITLSLPTFTGELK